MRRPRFATVAPGYPHHVILRGNNRRRICSYPVEYQRLVDLMAQAALRSGVPVHAVCVLSNHLHVVATPPDAPTLSLWVKRFAQPYAQFRNRRRAGSGKLFEERFFAKAIVSEAALAATLAYVDLNAVAAGLVTDPAEYAWSTFAHYAGEGRSRVPAALAAPLAWHEHFAGRPAAYASWVRDRAREVAAQRDAASAETFAELRRPNHARCG